MILGGESLSIFGAWEGKSLDSTDYPRHRVWGFWDGITGACGLCGLCI